MDILKPRWTHTEVRIAKQVLKQTLGNQKEAAEILQKKLNRSISSIKVKLCTLSKKHRSLRKKKEEKPAVNNTNAKVIFFKDHVRIYF